MHPPAPSDRDTFRRQVWRQLLRSPAVTLPVALGALSLSGAILAGEPAGFLGFLGVTGLVWGVGVAATKLILGTQALALEAARSEQAAAVLAEQDRVERLQNRLKTERDQAALSLLAELQRQRDRQLTALTAGSRWPADIVSKLDTLYFASLQGVERLLTLWHALADMATPEGRERMTRVRDDHLQEVEASVRQLAAAIDGLKAAALDRSGRHDELPLLRGELEEALRVAQRVEERMEQFESEFNPTPRERL